MTSPYDQFPKTPANYAPLTPLSFIARSAEVYANAVAVLHGDLSRTWSELHARSRQLASSLRARGITRNCTVSVLLNNTPEMVEAHFGIPMAGGVIHAINTRLEPETIAFQLEHGESQLIIVDREYSGLLQAALAKCGVKPTVICVSDPTYSGPGEVIGEDYETFIARGDAGFAWAPPLDEWDAIALSYTSGTTGNPKGVVTHHRGAYLNAVGNVATWPLPQFARYLWTLPLFHCNGWCFAWSLAAMAGVNVCLRKVEATAMWNAIKRHHVTHFCGAPIVHTTIMNADTSLKQGVDWQVYGMVAAAAPPAAMIEGMDKLGFDITHVYGLTEVYGPASVCAKQPEWASGDISERTRLNGRQGVRYVLQEGMTVMDPATMTPVPANGETMGEIMFRGNIAMKGYLKNPVATEESFADGWFHTGDLAVLHPDGYAKIKDRSKDIIISGGENISSLEVEDVLYRHADVAACAVVAKPDARWGEVPVAFVELRDGANTSAEALIAFCREHLAGFKSPKEIRFEAIPKTSTGKIQKFALRQLVKSTSAIE